MQGQSPFMASESVESREYLCTTIARDWSSGIVPQAFVRSSDWLLVVVGMSYSKCSTSKGAKRIEQHGTLVNEFN